MMQAALMALVRSISGITESRPEVIPWSCPVLCFGDPSTARVATLGLNPSNREFVDECGNELDGPLRRFHTLNSLGLDRWGEINATHLQLIIESCYTYFAQNPYDLWFRKLDYLISGTKASYYGLPSTACHLDLIPYATSRKWTSLESSDRSALLSQSGATFALLLRDSPIQVLILNGNAVVQNFERITKAELNRMEMKDWSLPRRANEGVTGYAYRGSVRRILDVELERELLVLGFNHNIQSSFGVTSAVADAIQHWISDNTCKLF